VASRECLQSLRVPATDSIPTRLESLGGGFGTGLFSLRIVPENDRRTRTPSPSAACVPGGSQCPKSSAFPRH
jgi:hypothetical protein